MTPTELRALRLRLGMTQGEAARYVAATGETWRSWESGRYTPDPRSLLLLRLLADDSVRPVLVRLAG